MGINIYTMTAGNNGGSGRAGNGSSDAKAGCPVAGGRRETSPRRCLASPRRRLAPPFARHCHHHVRRRHPTRTATATATAIGIVGSHPYRCCCHHQRRFFPPPSPLPLSPLSGCVRRAGCSGGTATPAVIRDRPDGRTTTTHYGTASAAALAVAEVTEEEECDGCDSGDP